MSAMGGGIYSRNTGEPCELARFPGASNSQRAGFLKNQRPLCGPLNNRVLKGTSQVSHCKNSLQNRLYNPESRGLGMLLHAHAETPLCYLRFPVCPNRAFCLAEGVTARAMPLPALCLEMQGLDLEESQLPSNLPTRHHKSATLNIRLPQRLFWKVPLNIFRLKSKVAK